VLGEHARIRSDELGPPLLAQAGSTHRLAA
jgi:hypothetical protein